MFNTNEDSLIAYFSLKRCVQQEYKNLEASYYLFFFNTCIFCKLFQVQAFTNGHTMEHEEVDPDAFERLKNNPPLIHVTESKDEELETIFLTETDIGAIPGRHSVTFSCQLYVH